MFKVYIKIWKHIYIYILHQNCSAWAKLNTKIVLHPPPHTNFLACSRHSRGFKLGVDSLRISQLNIFLNKFFLDYTPSPTPPWDKVKIGSISRDGRSSNLTYKLTISLSMKPKFKLNTIAYRLVFPVFVNSGVGLMYFSQGKNNFGINFSGIGKLAAANKKRSW